MSRLGRCQNLRINIIVYSKKVANGDYSSKLKPKSDDDELTVSLNKMAEKLEKINLLSSTEKEVVKGQRDLIS